MEITDVRVRKVALDGKMRAIVSITLDNEFVVHDIKVIEGEREYLLRCQAVNRRQENTEISHIPLTQRQEIMCRRLFSRNTRRLCRKHKLDFITIRQRYMNTYKRKTAFGQSFFLLQLSSSFGIMWLRENVT